MNVYNSLYKVSFLLMLLFKIRHLCFDFIVTRWRLILSFFRNKERLIDVIDEGEREGVGR